VGNAVINYVYNGNAVLCNIVV